MATDNPDEKPESKTSSAHSNVVDRVTAYIVDAHGGSVAPIDDARLHTYIADADWIAVVNAERAAKHQDPLSDAEALAVRPKLFSAKHVKAE